MIVKFFKCMLLSLALSAPVLSPAGIPKGLEENIMSLKAPTSRSWGVSSAWNWLSEKASNGAQYVTNSVADFVLLGGIGGDEELYADGDYAPGASAPAAAPAVEPAPALATAPATALGEATVDTAAPAPVAAGDATATGEGEAPSGATRSDSAADAPVDGAHHEPAQTAAPGDSASSSHEPSAGGDDAAPVRPASKITQEELQAQIAKMAAQAAAKKAAADDADDSDTDSGSQGEEDESDDDESDVSSVASGDSHESGSSASTTDEETDDKKEDKKIDPQAPASLSKQQFLLPALGATAASGLTLIAGWIAWQYKNWHEENLYNVRFGRDAVTFKTYLRQKVESFSLGDWAKLAAVCAATSAGTFYAFRAYTAPIK